MTTNAGRTDPSKAGRSTPSRNAKRGPVIMPIDPPFDVLRALAGDPVILCASDEKQARFCYALIRQTLIQRKRKVLPTAKEMRGILK